MWDKLASTAPEKKMLWIFTCILIEKLIATILITCQKKIKTAPMPYGDGKINKNTSCIVGVKIATIVDTFYQGSFYDTEPNMISRANPSN